MKIQLDVKRAHVLRRSNHPDRIYLELENGGEILAEAVSDKYSRLCGGRFDLEFVAPQGTAEAILKELGLAESELTVIPNVDIPFSEFTPTENVIPIKDRGKKP